MLQASFASLATKIYVAFPPPKYVCIGNPACWYFYCVCRYSFTVPYTQPKEAKHWMNKTLYAHPSRWTKTRVEYSYKHDMTTIGRNHQEQRTDHLKFVQWRPSSQTIHHYCCSTTTSWTRSHQDWNGHADVTLLFLRELSHVKSKPEKSMSHVHHLLSSIQLSIRCHVDACSYECGLDATHRSLSMGISIPARQQQHGGLRLLRSVFRGFLLFKVGCRACLKRRAGARILG